MKRKLSLRLTPLLMSLVMCAALPACGSKADNNNSGNSGTPASNSGTTNTTTTNNGSTATSSDLPEVTLHFIFFDGKKSATDQVWNAIGDKYKDKLNAKFDVQFIAGSDYKDKMLVKQSAGDSWDLNFDGEWLSYYQMTNLGAYMGLNELMPKYAPDLYKAYQESGVLKAATVGGQVVALPWGIVMNNRPFFQWRGDLIDYDASTIHTVEDTEKILYALKEKYPDKYIVENANRDVFNLKNNQMPMNDNFVFTVDGSKVTVMHVAETEAYRERAKYAEKWQKDGLIWADVLVDQLDHNQLINQGTLITKWGTHEFSNTTRAWVEPEAKWASNSLYDNNSFPNRTALANIVAIPRTSKNPERTLMFLNQLEIDGALYDMVHYGIEGTTYVMDGNKVAFPEGMNAANSNFQLWQGRWALFKPQFMRPDTEYSEGFWANEKTFATSNKNNIVSPVDGFSFVTESVTTEMAQLQGIFDGAEKMLDVGLAGDPDTAIDKLVQDLKNAGLDKVKAELQKQVDAFVSGN